MTLKFITATHFNPDSHFNIKALHSLEEAGIHLLSSLNCDIYVKQIQMALGLGCSPILPLNTLFMFWIMGKMICVPPTWRNLLQIFRQLTLDELAYQAENYLRRRMSENPPDTRAQKTAVVNGE